MEGLELLVIRAQQRDVEAYGEIVRRFQDMACGYAYSILGDSHLAEDAAQEAFIQAYRDLPALVTPEAFPGWFRKVVFKHCDRILRRRKEATAPLEAVAAVPAGQEQPHEAAEQREVRETVLAAVRALPESERTVTVLFYIDGYSQAEVADFLGVPVTTVNSRLVASRRRLKERMLKMVENTVKAAAPGDRFSKQVVRALLDRPRPLEIEGHPVRVVWEALRGALPEYEVMTGEEAVERSALDAVGEDMTRVYWLDGTTALRTQMTVSTMKAIRGRTPPVRLLAAGRVFRPDEEDTSHLKVFHQADGLCIEAGLGVEALKATVEKVLGAIFGKPEFRWCEGDFPFVDCGLEVGIKWGGEWLDVSGSGMLKPETLRECGLNPGAVSGFAFGLGLERLAMLKFCIEDIRRFWQPPYVPAR